MKRSPRVLDLHAKWESSWNAPQKTPEWRQGRKAFFELAKLMRNCFPDFPGVVLAHKWFLDAPWQRLEQQMRSELVKEVAEAIHHYWNRLPYAKLHIQTLRELEAANVKSVEAFRYIHEIFHTEDVRETEYGFFAVNWSYPDSEIRRAFEQWLSQQHQHRPKHGLRHIKHKQRRRGSFRDQLNWLGALRVKEHYPRKQLVDYPSPRLKIAALPYRNLTDLYDCAKKARELLRRLLQMADRS